MSLNRDFSKSINYKIISKLSEKSEIIGVNFIKIAPEMTSGYLFEKMCRIKIKFSYLILSYLMWFYMKYIVNFLSGNRYMAHNCIWKNKRQPDNVSTLLDPEKVICNVQFKMLSYKM